MKAVSIDASPKQLSRLRNGHRVRIKKAMEGTGFNLLVDPSKFDAINRSFTKGSAYQIQLSPDELMANKSQVEGQGIFAGRGIKKLAKSALKGLASAEKAVRKSKTGRTIVKKVAPLIAEKAVEAAATYAGADPATSKALGKIGSEGAKSGLGEAGYGLYAGMARGRGMCGGALLGPPSRMPEMSSISIGGTLLGKQSHIPPALQSDAMGANFHMNTQLPPQYQRGGVRFV